MDRSTPTLIQIGCAAFASLVAAGAPPHQWHSGADVAAPEVVSAVLPPGAVAAQARAATAPACDAGPVRRSERFRGEVRRGDRFSQVTGAGWVVRLEPIEYGWALHVSTSDRPAEDLSRLTPPWHFLPNPREIEGWHFRNADNTGPNDGSVNAPGSQREFIFSPAIGRGIDYAGSGTEAADVDRVRSFGRGWLFIESFGLTAPRAGERAALEALTFVVCLTWPAGQ